MKKYKEAEEILTQTDEEREKYVPKGSDYIPWVDIQNFVCKSYVDKQYKMSLFVLIASFFAMRIGDVLRLKWSDILDKDQFVLEEIKDSEKGNKKYQKKDIIIVSEAKDYIKSCFDKMGIEDKNEFIFNNRFGSGPFTSQYVNRKIKVLFSKYGLKSDKISSHSFRKSFGIKILEDNNYSNSAYKVVMELLEYKRKNDLMVYLGIKDHKIKDVYKSFKIKI